LHGYWVRPPTTVIAGIICLIPYLVYQIQKTRVLANAGKSQVQRAQKGKEQSAKSYLRRQKTHRSSACQKWSGTSK
jgi:hypothetical protein